MSNSFKYAPALRTRLLEIIDAHWPVVSKNLPRIEIVFQSAGIMARGQESVLKVVKKNGIDSFLAATVSNKEDFLEPTPFYCVLIHEETWNYMSIGQQNYRLDCACAAMAVEYNLDEDSVALRLETPNIQTYSAVVGRHSPSSMTDVQTLIRAAGQPSLFMMDDDEGTDEVEGAAAPTLEQCAENMTDEDREALKEGLKNGMSVTDGLPEVRKRGRPAGSMQAIA